MSNVSAEPLDHPPAAATPSRNADRDLERQLDRGEAVRAAAARADDGGDGVWAPARRRLTAALVLTITLVAFEALAIATVMPVVADDLGGLGLYGWVFSGFFLGSLLGIVLAGRAADRRGTRLPFAVGLALFTVGLVIGGAAQSMPMLVAGRVAQGMGAGVIPAVAYATVARAYPPELRPRVFAVFSSAWVIPGLVGPAAASAIEHASSWRVVFLALLPLVALAAGLALPALSAAGPSRGTADTPAGPDDRRRDAAVLVGGVALVLGGLGAHQPPLAVALVVVGALPAAWAFVRLVPEGTIALRHGLPAAVGARGILTFAFFGTDAYVSLAVTDVFDASTWIAGVALTAATLAWTTGAWVQQRLVAERGPSWLVRRGMALLAVGITGMLLAVAWLPVGVVIVAWAVAGLGIGLSYAPISVTVLGTAAPGQEGRASASLQLTDVLGVSLGTGIAGVFVALGDGRGWATSSSLTLAFAVTLAVAIGGVAAASRLPRRLPGLDVGEPADAAAAA
jgi:MFS family permease